MTIRDRSSQGYILLLSILVTGAVASGVVASLMLLGTGAQRTAFSIENSSKAIALGRSCIEYALEQLHTNVAYAGDEILDDFSIEGSCEILPIGGTGNNTRIVCAEAHVHQAVRRMEVIVQTLLPATVISSWQEVPFFTLCGW